MVCVLNLNKTNLEKMINNAFYIVVLRMKSSSTSGGNDINV